jgi:hypothetical protein
MPALLHFQLAKTHWNTAEYPGHWFTNELHSCWRLACVPDGSLGQVGTLLHGLPPELEPEQAMTVTMATPRTSARRSIPSTSR